MSGFDPCSNTVRDATAKIGRKVLHQKCIIGMGSSQLCKTGIKRVALQIIIRPDVYDYSDIFPSLAEKNYYNSSTVSQIQRVGTILCAPNAHKKQASTLAGHFVRHSRPAPIN